MIAWEWLLVCALAVFFAYGVGVQPRQMAEMIGWRFVRYETDPSYIGHTVFFDWNTPTLGGAFRRSLRRRREMLAAGYRVSIIHPMWRRP